VSAARRDLCGLADMDDVYGGESATAPP